MAIQPIGPWMNPGSRYIVANYVDARDRRGGAGSGGAGGIGNAMGLVSDVSNIAKGWMDYKQKQDLNNAQIQHWRNQTQQGILENLQEQGAGMVYDPMSDLSAAAQLQNFRANSYNAHLQQWTQAGGTPEALRSAVENSTNVRTDQQMKSAAKSAGSVMMVNEDSLRKRSDNLPVRATPGADAIKEEQNEEANTRAAADIEGVEQEVAHELVAKQQGVPSPQKAQAAQLPDPTEFSARLRQPTPPEYLVGTPEEVKQKYYNQQPELRTQPDPSVEAERAKSNRRMMALGSLWAKDVNPRTLRTIANMTDKELLHQVDLDMAHTYNVFPEKYKDWEQNPDKIYNLGWSELFRQDPAFRAKFESTLLSQYQSDGMTEKEAAEAVKTHMRVHYDDPRREAIDSGVYPYAAPSALKAAAQINENRRASEEHQVSMITARAAANDSRAKILKIGSDERIEVMKDRTKQGELEVRKAELFQALQRNALDIKQHNLNNLKFSAEQVAHYDSMVQDVSDQLAEFVNVDALTDLRGVSMGSVQRMSVYAEILKQRHDLTELMNQPWGAMKPHHREMLLERYKERYPEWKGTELSSEQIYHLINNYDSMLEGQPVVTVTTKSGKTYTLDPADGYKDYTTKYFQYIEDLEGMKRFYEHKREQWQDTIELSNAKESAMNHLVAATQQRGRPLDIHEFRKVHDSPLPLVFTDIEEYNNRYYGIS